MSDFNPEDFGEAASEIIAKSIFEIEEIKVE